MSKPQISNHYLEKKPSSIREAQIYFQNRPDRDTVNVINLSIGNISMPMYPSMVERLNNLQFSPFKKGVIRYSPTIGEDETRRAFLNILSSEGINTDNILANITDGGSSAMELMLLGVCGPNSKRPVMLLDPCYTNYLEFSKRFSIEVVTVNRNINQDGSFNKLDIDDIENCIKKCNPSAIVIIPFDNPTGQFIELETTISIAKLAVKYNLWLVCDEAYRNLFYVNKENYSIWSLNNSIVEGIEGRRISIESASKIWNACGLRIGALLTDNQKFHEKAIFEYTSNLSANSIGQYIFASLALEPKSRLKEWYSRQKTYYKNILTGVRKRLKNNLPGIIVTEPEAAIYMILDFKNICNPGFDAEEFILYCAKEGKVLYNEKFYTVLLAPMNGFYRDSSLGKTQLRLAIVESQDLMEISSDIIAGLYHKFTIK